MDELYLVTIEAAPAVGSELFEKYGGAYINVYTHDSTEDAAIATAMRDAEEGGWDVIAVEQVQLVTREDLADDPEALEDFEQALEHEVYSVVHTFPPDAQDDDVVH